MSDPVQIVVCIFKTYPWEWRPVYRVGPWRWSSPFLLVVAKHFNCGESSFVVPPTSHRGTPFVLVVAKHFNLCAKGRPSGAAASSGRRPSWNIKIQALCALQGGTKGTIGSDLVLDGRHEYEQIQGVLPVPAPVKQLLADAHSTASQLQIFWSQRQNISFILLWNYTSLHSAKKAQWTFI